MQKQKKTLRQLFVDLESMQRRMRTDEEYSLEVDKLTKEAYEVSKKNPLHVDIHDYLISQGATDEESLWIYGTINGLGSADMLCEIIAKQLGFPVEVVKRAIKSAVKNPC
jgi:hypothetical protein